MQIGFIGLGRMGIEMADRAVSAGQDLIGFDSSKDVLKSASARSIPVVESIDEMLAKLERPRTIWLQVQPGEPTQSLISDLSTKIDPGDTIIDAGNSDFRDSVKVGKLLGEKNIGFMDIGVSGGVAGAKSGCGMLVGGKKSDYDRMIPFYETLTAPNACAYCGGLGAGHYSKTIHNGIEYALMQAYAEGYEMLLSSEIELDVLGVLNAYQNGCSIRSHLLAKTIEAVEPDLELNDVVDYVSDSGMGRWTVEESIRLKVPTPTITAALQARFASQQDSSPAMRCIAAMRGVIGGHPVKKKKA